MCQPSMINTLEKRSVPHNAVGYTDETTLDFDNSPSIKNSGGGIKISGLSFSRMREKSSVELESDHFSRFRFGMDWRRP